MGCIIRPSALSEYERIPDVRYPSMGQWNVSERDNVLSDHLINIENKGDLSMEFEKMTVKRSKFIPAQNSLISTEITSNSWRSRPCSITETPCSATKRIAPSLSQTKELDDVFLKRVQAMEQEINHP